MLQLWLWSWWPECWSTLYGGCGSGAADQDVGAPFLADEVELLTKMLEHPILQLWLWSCRDLCCSCGRGAAGVYVAAVAVELVAGVLGDHIWWTALASGAWPAVACVQSPSWMAYIAKI